MSNVVAGGCQDRKQPAVDQFQPFTPTNWGHDTPPQLDWMVEGCFVRGTVAILAGDGGLGKSLLTQQLQTAAALGKPWLGLATQKCNSLALYCEDDREELHRRQVAINRMYGCSMADLAGVSFESRAGRDSVLMRFPKWGDGGTLTPMMAQLEYAAKEAKARIVILDPLADVFAGNEIDRNQPRTFLGHLRRLAIALQGVVILTQHPSNEGVNSGSGMSGSRGWNNSVRSRLYLTAPKKKGEDGTSDPDPKVRWLKTMKMNAGPFGSKIKLSWHNGCYVRADTEELPYYIERDGWKDGEEF